MSYATDLIGKKFGRLTVIEKTDKKDKGNSFFYRCKCDCGNEKLSTSWLLKSGSVSSCGCLRKEKPNGKTHGKSSSREYRIWAEMRKRCNNPKQKTYPYYGGRGIKVCERWGRFEAFLEDMGNCPEGFTLDRIDSNGNYEPNNCRWASRKEQARNRSSVHLITYNGKTQCLSAWAEEVGFERSTLKRRIYSGWSIEDALTKGVKK